MTDAENEEIKLLKAQLKKSEDERRELQDAYQDLYNETQEAFAAWHQKQERDKAAKKDLKTRFAWSSSVTGHDPEGLNSESDLEQVQVSAEFHKTLWGLEDEDLKIWTKEESPWQEMSLATEAAEDSFLEDE